MNLHLKFAVFGIVFLATFGLHAQHHSKLQINFNAEENRLHVEQQLTFFNQSSDTISTIILNDWNNAYADKNSLLGKRFSDEFVRSFHLASENDRGNTQNIVISDSLNSNLIWNRLPYQIDLVELKLVQKILPGQKKTIILSYDVKIPIDEFTHYGYNNKGEINLKNWYLTPARYENHSFKKYSNANLDDIANGISDYEIELTVPANRTAATDLNQISLTDFPTSKIYTFSGNNRVDFNLFISPKSKFESYKNDIVEVVTDFNEIKLDEIKKIIVIDHVVNFVNDFVGKYPHEKITVSQADYDRNPVYGLNQLPAFMSPFSNEFLYELKFLKTYLNNYLKTSLYLDPRKDNWIFDAIQVYAMMKYIDENHSDSKMMGSLAQWKLLRSYSLINLDFNEQYSYYYMLMLRKNLDQPLGDSKETLIRFNERIASKYRAGLSLKYLDSYLGGDSVMKSIRDFYAENKNLETTRKEFELRLKSNTDKNIDWFFDTIIDSRAIVDYKFGTVSKTPEKITFELKNNTGTTVPIPVYGIKDKQVVFKKWYENISTDSTFTVDRNNADKVVINYKSEVPEFNQRNNWKSLSGFFGNNRPYRFAFMKDLENANYNQILYVPTISYNLYDGLSPGLRLHNKTLLDKPLTFDINPIYSPKTQSLTGSFGFGLNQYNRESNLYNVRYGFGGSYYHYAPDAAYLKLNPSVQLLFREKDFRDNRRKGIVFKYNIVRKDHSEIVVDSAENYAVFTARYFNSKTEITNHINYNTDIQLSSNFGKLAAEVQYRKLFNNNRQLNFRVYAGTFLYNNSNTDYYNFGVSNPNDYLFDYNFFGRSETTGFYSQQIILAEGAFKSKLRPDGANQWLAATNVSFNVWNWIEVYGDVGFLKSRRQSADFLYDSGIRLNLVTDYFELYFPVYSNNGWEIAQPNYNQKIRFIFTFSPKSLINLFTRKWF